MRLVALFTIVSTQTLNKNPKALEAVWDWAYDKVGYLGTNTPIDQCYKCGFKGEFKAPSKGFECLNAATTTQKLVIV